MTARTTNAYVATIAAAAAIVFTLELARLEPSRIDVLAFLFLAVLAAVAQRIPIYLFRSSAVSVAYVATIAVNVTQGTSGSWA